MPTIRKTITDEYQKVRTVKKVDIILTKSQKKKYDEIKKQIVTIKRKITIAKKSNKPTKRLEKSLDSRIKKLNQIEEKSAFKEVKTTVKIRTAAGGFIKRRESTRVEKKLRKNTRYISGYFKIKFRALVDIYTTTNRRIEAGAVSYTYVESKGDIRAALANDLRSGVNDFEILELFEIREAKND